MNFLLVFWIIKSIISWVSLWRCSVWECQSRVSIQSWILQFFHFFNIRSLFLLFNCRWHAKWVFSTDLFISLSLIIFLFWFTWILWALIIFVFTWLRERFLLLMISHDITFRLRFQRISIVRWFWRIIVTCQVVQSRIRERGIMIEVLI